MGILELKRASIFTFVSVLIISTSVYVFDKLNNGIFNFYLPVSILIILNLFLLSFALLLHRKEIKVFFENKKERSKILYFIFFAFIFILAGIEFLTNVEPKFIDLYPQILNIVKVCLCLGFCISGAILFMVSGEEFTELVNPKDIGKNILNLKTETQKTSREDFLFYVGLIVISLIFIVITFGLPFIYTGSFMDEYSHINSAVEMSKTGHFIPSTEWENGYYMRGAFVSSSVYLAFYLFGENILWAELIPPILGLLSFLLLFSIGKILIKNRNYILLLLLLYTLNPLVLFNHFYLRMYVFYEFFALAIIFAFLKMSLSKNKNWNVIYYLSIILAINAICYFYSYDYESYILIALSALLLAYFFISNLREETSLKIMNVQISRAKIFKILILVLIISSYFVFSFSDVVDKFLYGYFQGSSSEDIKYLDYFFVQNTFFTSIFVLSVISTIFVKYKNKRYIFAIFGLIFFIHMISSMDIQLIRLILYFIPIMILMAVTVVSVLAFKFKKIGTILAISMIILYVTNPALSSFAEIPELPNEVYYIDYKEVNDFVTTTCKDKVVVVLNASYALNFVSFYKMKVDYIPYIYNDILEADTGFKMNEDGSYEMVGFGTKVIPEGNYVEKMKNESVCIITPNRYRFAWRGIKREDFDNLGKIFNEKDFTTVNIYYK